MKPNLSTPDTVLLAFWVDGECAACIGLLRDACGLIDAQRLTLHAWGAPWPTLAQALALADALPARHCIVATNWEEALHSIAPRLRPPLPDKEDAKGVPYGGDLNHWEVIRRLGSRFAGRNNAVYAASLPRTEELWHSKFSS